MSRPRRRPRPLDRLLAAAFAGSIAVSAAAQEPAPTWHSAGPLCARSLAIAAGPTPTAPAYLAVGARLFRSRDGWLSWHEVGRDLPLFDGAFSSSVAADPVDPRRLVFSVFGAGVFRSADGGDGWTPVPPGPPSLVHQLWSASQAPGTFFAVDGVDGVFKSTDAGISWRRVDPPAAMPNYHLFAPGPGPALRRLWLRAPVDLLWRSDDDGESWEPAVGGLPGGEIGHVAADPARAAVTYLTRFKGLWRSDDASNWTLVGEIPSNTFTQPNALVALPGEPGILLAGQNGENFFSSDVPGLVRSDDAGVTWAPQGLVGENVYELRYLPETGWVVASTGSGAFVSRDLGASWHRIGRGVNAAHATAVATAGGDHGRLLATVTECDGARIAHSDDGGRTWRLSSARADELLDLATAPSQPLTVFAGARDGVWRSVDGGETWQQFEFDDGISGGRVASVAVHPTSPGVVFAASSGSGLARSVNGGITWQTGLLDHLDIRFADAVAFDPHQPLRVLAGGFVGLARSLDGGSSWSAVPGFEDLDVRELVFDAGTPGRVLAATPFGPAPLMRSADGGATWQPAGAGLDLEPLALTFHPAEPGVVLAGTEEGLYRSSDGGATWAPWPEAVGDVLVRDLLVDPRGRVHAATRGEGVMTSEPPGAAEGCTRDPNVACLLDGAFEVRGAMWDFETPVAERTLAVMEFAGGRAESDQAVFFDSFRPGNFELGVKMVDACGLPAGDPLRAYWVFAGGLTNAASEVVVEDTVGGGDFRWQNPAGSFPRATGDTGAFPCTEGPPAAPCLRGDHTACLLGGRFRVTGVMHDFSEPPRAVPARVMDFSEERAESDQAVFFDAFRRGNFELGVKMVDACALPSGDPLRAYWAFYGGLTNAEAQLVVTQIATGLTDAWSNRGGDLALSEGHTAAFPCLE